MLNQKNACIEITEDIVIVPRDDPGVARGLVRFYLRNQSMTAPENPCAELPFCRRLIESEPFRFRRAVKYFRFSGLLQFHRDPLSDIPCGWKFGWSGKNHTD